MEVLDNLPADGHFIYFNSKFGLRLSREEVIQAVQEFVNNHKDRSVEVIGAYEMSVDEYVFTTKAKADL